MPWCLGGLLGLFGFVLVAKLALIQDTQLRVPRDEECARWSLAKRPQTKDRRQASRSSTKTLYHSLPAAFSSKESTFPWKTPVLEVGARWALLTIFGYSCPSYPMSICWGARGHRCHNKKSHHLKRPSVVGGGVFCFTRSGFLPQSCQHPRHHQHHLDLGLPIGSDWVAVGSCWG